VVERRRRLADQEAARPLGVVGFDQVAGIVVALAKRQHLIREPDRAAHLAPHHGVHPEVPHGRKQLLRLAQPLAQLLGTQIVLLELARRDAQAHADRHPEHQAVIDFQAVPRRALRQGRE
jgi:hypothetical protein